jgi:hypothetical protein
MNGELGGVALEEVVVPFVCGLSGRVDGGLMEVIHLVFRGRKCVFGSFMGGCCTF